VVEKVTVEDCGSVNGKGRNNTSGGILIEEGSEDFTVKNSLLRRVMGNGIWTHSTFKSKRNFTGVFEGNRIETVGRDAIQVGHANRVKVINNSGRGIGYPASVVDVDGGGIPVAIDTAGKVDEGVYSNNKFEEINGKCFDLDGFHDGEVSGNVCINRGPAGSYPQGHFGLVMNNTNQEMQSQNIVVTGNTFDGTKYGGIYVIGTGHKILNNTLTRINLAKCNEQAHLYGCSFVANEPELMQSGIYLGTRAERPAMAEGNMVVGNKVSGHMMARRCVVEASPVTGKNTIRGNVCVDEP
jgi:parallel beta-helix repeat protein